MDPSWCPGCDKLILPKRYIVPVNPTPTPQPRVPTADSDSFVSSDPEHDPNHPPPPPAPTPVPSSPEVRKKPLPGHGDAQAHRAAAVRRAHAYGGGLVHGTGRVRPGGGLKPRQEQPKKHAPSPPKPAPQPKAASAQDAEVVMGNPTAAQTSSLGSYPAVQPTVATPTGKKTRIVISQEPTPLYCSDECRARDLKNSFIETESAGFAGAPAAIHRVNQLELVQETVERSMKGRRASASFSDRSAPQRLTPRDAFPLPVPSPMQWQAAAEEASLPPVPPNSLVDTPKPIFRTGSVSSASSSSTASSSRIRHSDSQNNTIRAPILKARPRLPSRSSSFSTWGSPSKAALAPPARTLLNASSSSLDSSVSSVGSALFDDDAFIIADKGDGEDTCGTTPSRRGSGSSAESKKKKRVSFASESKPSTLVESAVEVVRDRIVKATPVTANQDWRLPQRRRNPLLDANPLRDAVSVSPKDRVKASSLPTDLPPTAFSKASPQPSYSTPSLAARVVDTPSPNRTPRYSVAMWPEDEKRTTESARVHGELLRGYAKRFGPREGRSFVWGRLWAGHEDAQYREAVSASTSPAKHELQPDSRRTYWREFEEREAEARARRKAEALVQREEEERVICELLGGAGMREEDQPQARRMKQMAYDGMPGPAELRGLTYKFDRFLYPLIPPKSTIVEKTVRRWVEERREWVEEITREEVFEERKKLFNFLED